MFQKRTVFIVGAGASREVKFPMGAELTKTIAQKLHIGSSGGWRIDFGDAKIVEAVEFAKQAERDKNPYWRAGRSIAAGMSQAISIDNYLHAHADDETIVWMGKLGIAASILDAEKVSKLAPNPGSDSVYLANVSDSWFTPFFQMLTEGVQTSTMDRMFANLAFITFNYDRCIEHYLAHAISNYFQVDMSRACQLVNTLRIEHPYGKVGKLPWQEQRGSIAFGKGFNPRDLPLIAGQIRTFTEQVEDQEMLKRSKSLIAEAEIVVFLGFSYADMNIELLSNSKLFLQNRLGNQPRLVGTQYCRHQVACCRKDRAS